MAELPSKNPQPASTFAQAFLSRDFRRYQLARLIVIIGAEAQSVAVAWEVYQLTHSPLMLGLTGLALFLPGLFCVLPAGHAADRYDRRLLILGCYVLQSIASAALFYISYYGTRHIITIYAVLLLIGLCRAFSGPASSALVPQLVPKEHFVNAVTWGATVFQSANMAGPAVGRHSICASSEWAARCLPRRAYCLPLHRGMHVDLRCAHRIPAYTPGHRRQPRHLATHRARRSTLCMECKASARLHLA